MDETDFFQAAKTNFAHLLGYGEKLNKTDYLKRFKMMYSLSDDLRNKAFYEAAFQASFNAISRSHKGITIEI